MLLRRFRIYLSALLMALSIPAGAQNDPDFRRPFGVDANTVALFHFDKASGNGADNSVEGEPDGVLNGAMSGWPSTSPGSESEYGAALMLLSEADSMSWNDSARLDL